jgi:hypothetical protein
VLRPSKKRCGQAKSAAVKQKALRPCKGSLGRFGSVTGVLPVKKYVVKCSGAMILKKKPC